MAVYIIPSTFNMIPGVYCLVQSRQGSTYICAYYLVGTRRRLAVACNRHTATNERVVSYYVVRTAAAAKATVVMIVRAIDCVVWCTSYCFINSIIIEHIIIVAL